VGCGGSKTTASTAREESGLARVDRVVRSEMPGVYGFIVMQDGRPLLERYYHNATAGQPFQTHSVTKSVVSLLVGIAIAEGKLPGLDAKVSEFLTIPRKADPRVRAITLRQLLTMTAGWRDQQVRGGNVVRAILVRPLARAPGTAWEYDSGSSHVVSAILARATRRSTASYAQQKLFGPLGIQPLRWPADPQGVTSGSGGLIVRARELALIGELVRRGGVWSGEQVVPQQWIEESTRNHVATDDSAFGYGYYWWIERKTGAAWARGYGGQVIAVAPRQRAVVVIGSDPAQRPDTVRIVNELVLPELRG
jgi:CubicO group peptidase (beta-lactamase class C family)